jgi:hypothetical protein
MNAEATKLVAEALAQRVGIGAADVEVALRGDPMGAVLALSLLGGLGAKPPAVDPADTIRFVAAIVGACARCLGEDDGCGACAGAGKPGMRAPQRDAFLAWIALPLRRLGLCVSAMRRERANSEHEGGFSR